MKSTLIVFLICNLISRSFSNLMNWLVCSKRILWKGWSALGIEEELSPNTFTSPPILAHMWTLCFRRGVEQVWPAYLFWNSFTTYMLKPGTWSLMYSILHKNVRDEGTVSVFWASFSFFPELHIHAMLKIHVLVWILAWWGNWVWNLGQLQRPLSWITILIYL